MTIAARSVKVEYGIPLNVFVHNYSKFWRSEVDSGTKELESLVISQFPNFRGPITVASAPEKVRQPLRTARSCLSRPNGRTMHTFRTCVRSRVGERAKTRLAGARERNVCAAVQSGYILSSPLHRIDERPASCLSSELYRAAL